MTDEPDDELHLDPDAPVSGSPEFSDALRARLELQQQIQNTPVQSSITPYLAVANATRAIEFYAGVFGATLVGEPFLDPSARVTHAELNIKGATVYLSDEFPESGIVGPGNGTGHPVSLVIEVGDADLCMEAAVAAGADVERPVQDQWDARSGWFVDPFGHRWSPTSRSNRFTKETAGET